MPFKLEFRDDGILQATFSGYLDTGDMEGYLHEYNRVLDSAQSSEKLHFLVNSDDVTKVSSSARKAFVQMLRQTDPRIGYTAMVGGSRYVRVLTSFVLKAVGRDDIRSFESEGEALVWLKK